MLHGYLNNIFPEWAIYLIAAGITFLITFILYKKPFSFLPIDGGKKVETPDGKVVVINDKSAGKVTGAGFVFMIIFVICGVLFLPFQIETEVYLVLMFVMMMTGYLDDVSKTPWGEYVKGSIDLVVAIITVVVYLYFNSSDVVIFGHLFHFPVVVYAILAVILIWASVNVTNCSDGVDGLCASVTIVELLAYNVIFGIDIVIFNGMGIMMIGALIAYLFYNWNPSKILMGDAGSRPIGYLLALMAMQAGHPFIFLILSSVFIFDGGIGIIKVSIMRFLKKPFLSNITFPFHDHLRKKKGWAVKKVALFFAGMEVIAAIVALIIIFSCNYIVLRGTEEPTTSEEFVIRLNSTATDADATSGDASEEEKEETLDFADRHNLFNTVSDYIFDDYKVEADSWEANGLKISENMVNALVPGSVIEVRYKSESGKLWIVFSDKDGSWKRIGQGDIDGTGKHLAYTNDTNNIIQITYEQIADELGTDVSKWGDMILCESDSKWKVDSLKVGMAVPTYQIYDAVEFKGFNVSAAKLSQAGRKITPEIRKALVPGSVIEIKYKSESGKIWLVMNDAEVGWTRIGDGKQSGENHSFAAADGETAYISFEEMAKALGDDTSKWGESMQCESDSPWEVYSIRVGKRKEFVPTYKKMDLNASVSGTANKTSGIELSDEALGLLVPGSYLNINYRSSGGELWVVFPDAGEKPIEVGSGGFKGSKNGYPAYDGSFLQIPYEMIEKYCGTDKTKWGKKIEFSATGDWEVKSAYIGYRELNSLSTPTDAE